MKLPFLIALFTVVSAHLSTVQLNDPIPIEEKVYRASLPNGIKMYVQVNERPAGFGSFRVVLRKPSCDEVLYSFDSELSSMDLIESFFSYCSNEASQLLHDQNIFRHVRNDRFDEPRFLFGQRELIKNGGIACFIIYRADT